MADGVQRLFVAVPLPPESAAACVALIEGIRAGPLGRVPRWVDVANLHLTVRFLGPTPAALLPDVERAVLAAASGARAFDVVLAGAGSFPAGKKPRALWLGIEQGSDELGALALAAGRELAPLGWDPDPRPYRPHLTVARLDAAPSADGTAIAEALGSAAAAWRTAFRAERVVLYRSHLGGGPPKYEPLVVSELS